MYNYLYDCVPHTDTSTEYLKKLGMDEESIEALQRDAKAYEEQQFAEFIEQRNGFLNESDWMILRHNDQITLNIGTNMTPEVYIDILNWRQQLRNMPETMAGDKARAIVWPPLPPVLEDEFPDYPG